jgi:outer membrane protein OmpA-like peptidoglycan-associated protein
MSSKIRISATLVAVALSGCANMDPSQTATAQGAGIGAAAGAVLGALTAGGNTGSSMMQGAALGAVVGAVGGYAWNQHLEKQKQQMQAATAGTGMQVTQTADNRLKVNVPADAGFASGSAQINTRLYAPLDRLAQGVLENPNETVMIVGHTDSSGDDAINLPLSRNRALSVRNYLVSRGISESRIQTAGRGAADPVADNATPQGRALNRRVEIYVAAGAQKAG